MAEAVFASEQIEELAFSKTLACLAVLFAPVPRLPENFLMRHCPRYTRYGKAEDQKKCNLLAETHYFSQPNNRIPYLDAGNHSNATS